jgi:hypothetical protein
MKEKALQNLHFDRICVDRAGVGMRFAHVRGLTLKEVSCNSADGRPVQFEDCTEVSHLGADVETDRTAADAPPELRGYDPAGLVRFKTVAEADARRMEQIRFIWPGGLPTD